MEQQTCVKCSASLAEDDSFCGDCGTKQTPGLGLSGLRTTADLNKLTENELLSLLTDIAAELECLERPVLHLANAKIEAQEEEEVAAFAMKWKYPAIGTVIAMIGIMPMAHAADSGNIMVMIAGGVFTVVVMGVTIFIAQKNRAREMKKGAFSYGVATKIFKNRRRL